MSFPRSLPGAQEFPSLTAALNTDANSSGFPLTSLKEQYKKLVQYRTILAPLSARYNLANAHPPLAMSVYLETFQGLHADLVCGIISPFLF